MAVWNLVGWISKVNLFSIDTIKWILILLFFILIVSSSRRNGTLRSVSIHSLLLASVVQADMPVYKVVVGPVPGYTGVTAQDYSTMPGWIFTQEVTCRVQRSLGYNIEIEFISSWSRANYMFRQKHIDILFPEIVGDTTQPGITGTLVGKGNGFSFYMHTQSSKTIRSWNDLEGTIIAILRGRFYPPELLNNNKIAFQEVNTPEQAFRMLEAGRVDLVAENPFIAQALLKTLNLADHIKPIELVDENNHNKIFTNHYIAYRFHADTEGIRLLEAFNIAIGEMLATGVYQEIFANVPQAFSGLSKTPENKDRINGSSTQRCYKNG